MKLTEENVVPEILLTISGACTGELEISKEAHPIHKISIIPKGEG